MNKISVKLRAVPKWTKGGILGVILIYTSVAGMLSAALPWGIGNGGSALHIDYALIAKNR